MALLIEARDLTKKYGAHVALDRANLKVEAGRIVGLIGPNGAGKTSALRAILGLTHYEGHLTVLGREPFRQRTELMNECCFIADVAVLPSWLRVDQAIDFVAGVHPRFRRDRASAFLAKTQITGKRRMRELSKGMKTQVHLALTMAIDAKLLVLDEPTLGLDILARRAFYDALVNDYMDETRTILITTHQVEEVENLLTDVIFIDKGASLSLCPWRTFRRVMRPWLSPKVRSRQLGRSSRFMNDARWARHSFTSKRRTSTNSRPSAR